MIFICEKKEKEAIFHLVCPKCGYTKYAGDKPSVIPKVIERSLQEPIAIIGKEEQKLRTLPTVRVECPKCGNNTAFAWQVQTTPAYFMHKCTKCEYSFRAYE